MTRGLMTKGLMTGGSMTGGSMTGRLNGEIQWPATAEAAAPAAHGY